MRSILAYMYMAAATAFGAGNYTIGTIAGSDWAGDGGSAASAILIQPEGVLADGSGNLYIADAGDHRVRKVAPNGVIRTLAGTGVRGFAGDGGPAVQAQLNAPYGLALDNQGFLYIADLGNARVRRVAPDGTITTVAGGGSLPAGGLNEGSPAAILALSQPRNLVFDTGGNLYISDFGGQRVYRMGVDGSLTTVAGTGVAGASGDNGAAVHARVNCPAGLAFDSQGALYIADSGSGLVRKVAHGLITSFARAVTPTGLAFDAQGTLYVADISAGDILVIPATGSPSNLAVAAVDVSFSGVGLWGSTANQAVLVEVKGLNIPVAGGGSLEHGDNGPATQARLNHPSGVSMDAAGNVYVADRDNNRIRRVGTDGAISTVAGTGTAGNSGDGGLAVEAQLSGPESVTVDGAGNLYIADTGNQRVRKVTPDGKIAAATNLGLLSPVYAIPDGSGNLYIADDGAGKILTAGSSGVPATLVAGLSSPRGLALDSLGNLYYTEAGAARVSVRSPAGIVSSIGAGSWNIPRGVAVDRGGNVYVADTGLQQVLQVAPSGGVTVIAGTGSAGLSGDGGSATAAQLGFPWDVAVNGSGVIAVADLDNNRVRDLAPPAQTLASSGEPVPGNVTVVNAASLAPGPVAAGMLLLIGGSGLGPAQIPDTAIAFGPYPARILSADANSILVVAPAPIAGLASVPIEILYQNAVIASLPVAVVDSAPALFADSTGQAAANNQDGSINSASNPAARGSVISLYGTGMGISSDAVTVTFDGYSSQVQYAGPVANYPGLFQINAQVPSGYLPAGDLTVVVTVGTSPSQQGITIWVD
jgi:uncharacterized protein (TIGR03437 family)